MPRASTIQGYQFHELSQSAKERVIQKMWEHEYDWWDCIYEDFKIVAAALGFETHTRSYTYDAKGPDGKFNGKKATRTDDEIWFEERYGWTAGYNATWRLLDATQAVKNIKDHVGDGDKHLIRLATVLEAEITKFAIEGLEPIMREGNVVVQIVGNEHGIKDGCDSLEWSSDYELTIVAAAVSLGITVEATAKDLARWLAKQLESEADYRQSEEAVKEHCEANEYLFDERGEML